METGAVVQIPPRQGNIRHHPFDHLDTDMDFLSQLSAAHRQIEQDNQRKALEYVTNVKKHARQKEVMADRNKRAREKQRAAIVAAITPHWESSSEIAARAGCVRSSAYKHLVVMETEGTVERKGDSKHTKWRKL